LTAVARSRPGARAALALVLAALAIAGVVQLFPSLRDLVDAARTPVLDQTGDRRNAAGLEAGLDARFADWVAARVPPHASIWIEPGGPAGDATLYQWLTYRLLPRVHAPSAAAADAILFYDARSKRPRPGFGALEVFGKRFALMRREPR
jgi:hypothetical protein